MGEGEAAAKAAAKKAVDENGAVEAQAATDTRKAAKASADSKAAADVKAAEGAKAAADARVATGAKDAADKAWTSRHSGYEHPELQSHLKSKAGAYGRRGSR